MEFKNVVFNAARDGKLRRLKVNHTVATAGILIQLLACITYRYCMEISLFVVERPAVGILNTFFGNTYRYLIIDEY
jgi:hypothetical protein